MAVTKKEMDIFLTQMLEDDLSFDYSSSIDEGDNYLEIFSTLEKALEQRIKEKTVGSADALKKWKEISTKINQAKPLIEQLEKEDRGFEEVTAVKQNSIKYMASFLRDFQSVLNPAADPRIRKQDQYNREIDKLLKGMGIDMKSGGTKMQLPASWEKTIKEKNLNSSDLRNMRTQLRGYMKHMTERKMTDDPRFAMLDLIQNTLGEEVKRIKKDFKGATGSNSKKKAIRPDASQERIQVDAAAGAVKEIEQQISQLKSQKSNLVEGSRAANNLARQLNKQTADLEKAQKEHSRAMKNLRIAENNIALYDREMNPVIVKNNGLALSHSETSSLKAMISAANLAAAPHKDVKVAKYQPSKINKIKYLSSNSGYRNMKKGDVKYISDATPADHFQGQDYIIPEKVKEIFKPTLVTSASSVKSPFNGDYSKELFGAKNKVQNEAINKARDNFKKAQQVGGPLGIAETGLKLVAALQKPESAYGTAMHKIAEELIKHSVDPNYKSKNFSDEQLNDPQKLIDVIFGPGFMKNIGYDSELAGATKLGKERTGKDINALYNFVKNSGQRFHESEIFSPMAVVTNKGTRAIVNSISDAITEIGGNPNNLAYTDFKFRKESNRSFEEFTQGLSGAMALNAKLKYEGSSAKVNRVDFKHMEPGTGKMITKSMGISDIDMNDYLDLLDLAGQVNSGEMSSIDAIAAMPVSLQKKFAEQYLGKNYTMFFDKPDKGGEGYLGRYATAKNPLTSSRYVKFGKNNPNISANNLNWIIKLLGGNEWEKSFASKSQEDRSYIAKVAGTTLGNEGKDIVGALDRGDQNALNSAIKNYQDLVGDNYTKTGTSLSIWDDSDQKSITFYQLTGEYAGADNARKNQIENLLVNVLGNEAISPEIRRSLYFKLYGNKNHIRSGENFLSNREMATNVLSIAKTSGFLTSKNSTAGDVKAVLNFNDLFKSDSDVTDFNKMVNSLMKDTKNITAQEEITPEMRTDMEKIRSVLQSSFTNDQYKKLLGDHSLGDVKAVLSMPEFLNYGGLSVLSQDEQRELAEKGNPLYSYAPEAKESSLTAGQAFGKASDILGMDSASFVSFLKDLEGGDDNAKSIARAVLFGNLDGMNVSQTLFKPETSKAINSIVMRLHDKINNKNLDTDTIGIANRVFGKVFGDSSWSENQDTPGKIGFSTAMQMLAPSMLYKTMEKLSPEQVKNQAFGIEIGNAFANNADDKLSRGEIALKALTPLIERRGKKGGYDDIVEQYGKEGATILYRLGSFKNLYDNANEEEKASLMNEFSGSFNKLDPEFGSWYFATKKDSKNNTFRDFATATGAPIGSIGTPNADTGTDYYLYKNGASSTSERVINDYYDPTVLKEIEKKGINSKYAKDADKYFAEREAAANKKGTSSDVIIGGTSTNGTLTNGVSVGSGPITINTDLVNLYANQVNNMNDGEPSGNDGGESESGNGGSGKKKGKKATRAKAKRQGTQEDTSSDSAAPRYRGDTEGSRGGQVRYRQDIFNQAPGQMLGGRSIWESLNGSMKNVIARFLEFGLAYKVINLVKQGLSKVITAATELDKVLTNLRIVTGKTEQETKSLLNTYADMAIQLGATTAEVASAANEWLRQGYSVSETNDLITASLYLSKLGMTDSTTATKVLTSTLKGFNLEASEAVNIVDKLTKLDMSAATSAAEIGEGLSQFAATGSLAGLTTDEAASLVTTIADVTQKSGSAVGTALRTIISRYGNVRAGKYNLLDVSTDSEDISEKINDVERVLGKIGISLRSSNLEFKDFADVLDELALKWNTLDSVSKRAVSTAFAGVRQQEYFNVLMQNYDKYKEYLNISTNSAGTAEEKYQSYTEQLEASQKKLQASWEALAQDSNIADFMTTINNVLAKAVEWLPLIVKYASYLFLQFRGFKIPAALLQLLGGNNILGRAGVALNGGNATKFPVIGTRSGGTRGGASRGSLDAGPWSTLWGKTAGKSIEDRRLLKESGINTKGMSREEKKAQIAEIKQQKEKNALEVKHEKDLTKEYLEQKKSVASATDSVAKESAITIQSATAERLAKQDILSSAHLEQLEKEGVVTKGTAENFKKTGVLTKANLEELQKGKVVSEAQKELMLEEQQTAEDQKQAAAESQSSGSAGAGAGSGAKVAGLMIAQMAINQSLSALSNALQSGSSHSRSANPYDTSGTTESSERAQNAYKASSSAFTLLIPFIGQTIGDAVGNGIANSIDREKDERNDRVEAATEIINALGNASEAGGSMISLGKNKGSWTAENRAEAEESANSYLDTMYSEENEETRGLVEKYLNKVLVKMGEQTEENETSINDAVKTIVNGDNISAERMSKALEIATAQANAEANLKASEADFENLNQKSADVASDYLGYTKAAQLAGGNTQALVTSGGVGIGAGVGTAAGILTAAGVGAAGGAAAGPIGAAVGFTVGLIVSGVGALIGYYSGKAKEAEALAEAQEEWKKKSLDEQILQMEQARANILSQDTVDEKSLNQINQILDTLYDIQAETNKIYQEMNEQQAQIALLSAKSGEDYLMDMTIAQLKKLGIEGIYEAMAAQLEEAGVYGGRVYDSDGQITAFAKDLITDALRDDSEIASVLNGESYSLNEALKLDRSKQSTQDILKNFADALSVNVADLDALGDKYGLLTLSDLLLSLTDLGTKIEDLSDVATSILDSDMTMSSWINTIISKFPELIEYMSDPQTLFGAVMDKSDQLSQAYLLAQAQSIGETPEYYENKILPSILEQTKGKAFDYKGTSGMSVEDILNKVGVTNTNDLMKWFLEVGTTEGVGKEVYDAYLKASEGINLVSDVARSQLDKIIEYRTTMLTKEIDNLTEQKEALENINSQREYENKLIEAKLKLENAQKDKKRVWREGVGWVYESDQTAVKEAQDELDTLENEKTISELEEQIKQLEDDKKQLEDLSSEKELALMKEYYDAWAEHNNVTDASAAGVLSTLNTLYDGVTQSLSTIIEQQRESDEQKKQSALGELGDLWEKLVAAETSGDIEAYNTALSNYQEAYKNAKNAGYVNGSTFSSSTAYGTFGSEASNQAGQGGIYADSEGNSHSYKQKQEAVHFTLPGNGHTYKVKTTNQVMTDGNTMGYIMSDIRTNKATIWKNEDGWTTGFNPNDRITKPEDDETLWDYAARIPDAIIVGGAGDNEWVYTMGGKPWILTQEDDKAEGGFKWGYTEAAARGSLGLAGGLSLINEQGTEALVTPYGTITSLPSGTGVVPADITKNLWELGNVAPIIQKLLMGNLNDLQLASVGANSNDDSFNVGTINMTVNADGTFDVDAWVNAIKSKVALTKNTRR